MTIKNWPLLERPREKLFEVGAKNLSDAELVALLLGSGGNRKSALDLARDLLQRFDGLAGLLSTDFRQIARVAGIGPAKAASLAAMRELGHRQLYAEVQNRDVLSSSQATREYLRAPLPLLQERDLQLHLPDQPASHPAARRTVSGHDRRRRRLSAGSR